MFTLNVPLYYTPKYFKPHELVSPEIYKDLGGNASRIIGQFDRCVLVSADKLREAFGPVMINNWYEATSKGYKIKSGGSIFKQSGMRDRGAVAHGARRSQHYLGRALDLKFLRTTAPQVMMTMEKLGLFLSGSWRMDPDPIYDPFRLITTIERSVKGTLCSWLHIDTRIQPKGNGAIVPLDL